jgi:hypothetical protein
MKILSTFTPAFVPGASGVGYVDFGLLPGFQSNKLYAIINTSAGVPIYIAGAPGLGATSIVGSRLYLTYSTSSHTAADVLNVYYEASTTRTELNLAQETNGNMDQIAQFMEQTLIELKVMNVLLKEGLNIRDELDQLRADVQSDDKR